MTRSNNYEQFLISDYFRYYIFNFFFACTAGSPANRKEESSPGLKQKPISSKRKTGNISMSMNFILILLLNIY